MPFIAQLRKTQIPKTVFDKISDFCWNTCHVIFQSGKFLAISNSYRGSGKLSGFLFGAEEGRSWDTSQILAQEPNIVQPNTGYTKKDNKQVDCNISALELS